MVEVAFLAELTWDRNSAHFRPILELAEEKVAYREQVHLVLQVL
jgi:hypothetical protein